MHPDELPALAKELAPAPRIALDIEGDGFHRYRARLCTLQLAAVQLDAVQLGAVQLGAVQLGADEAVRVVDTLRIEELAPLAALLGEGGPVKVVHDASFDARMLARRGITLARVFDTSIAARFLGESATGLASLLARHLGVTLVKEEQQGDWGARPLSPEQLDYLVADVTHLLPLAALLEARLREADLIEEVQEETRYMLARALEPEPVREPWTRIKGARDLPPSALALLSALADVREREAERRDVPPFRVAPNGALFEAARRDVREIGPLRQVRGLRGLDDDALASAIALSERGPPLEEEPAAPPPEERARRRAREKALSTWRRAEAERRGVNEQAVLPGHCLRDLAGADGASLDVLAQVEGLGAKRIERYGGALIALLG